MSAVGAAKAKVHVIFTESGAAGWFGPEPVPGSEPLALAELMPLLPEGAGEDQLAVVWRELLIRHCRVDGRWLPRPKGPTGEDLPEGIAGEVDPVAAPLANGDKAVEVPEEERKVASDPA